MNDVDMSSHRSFYYRLVEESQWIIESNTLTDCSKPITNCFVDAYISVLYDGTIIFGLLLLPYFDQILTKIQREKATKI